MIMTFTMRRENREEIGRRAWLETADGDSVFDCTLIDISPSGAKIEVEGAARLPNTFALRLTRHGHPNFSCRVVWRNVDAVGVTFTNVKEITRR